ELRLSNGTGPCSGRVEVKHEEQWGTVCDGDWTIEDAEVVCKQLQCGSAVQALNRAPFGEGSGPTWLYRVDCHGNESFLWNCSHTGWGTFTCPHYFDIGVICSGFSGLRLAGGDTACSGHLKVKQEETWATVCYGGYRLANGSTTCSGNVELLHGGTWGPLCDYLWDLPAANALCQQLDCGVALLIPGGQSFGKGNGSVWNGTFSCKTNGSHLRGCPVSVLGPDECPSGKDAHVVCSGSVLTNQGTIQSICTEDRGKVLITRSIDSPRQGKVAKQIYGPTGEYRCPGGRLVNGTTCSGRVEIRHGDTWGRLCSSHWNFQAANALCRQLNCGYAKSIQTEGRFLDGNGLVWRDAFHCEGTESCLWDCTQVTLGNPTCSAREAATVICSGVAEDVGVICSGSRRIRLMNGTERCAGRVELFHDGIWGTICDDNWDLSDANVVCKQLGCGHAIKAFVSAHYGEGSGQIWLDDVNCTGAEPDLWACPSRAWGQHNCQHKEDAGVLC
ncbi:Scavenger receptor cysteine-rich type 1 protein M130, partial [Pterocles gutturalis]